MTTAQDVTDITCQHKSCLFLMFKLILQNFKGLLFKIKVIKGFSAKLKVLKDCNQIKGFKGSTRGPAFRMLSYFKPQQTVYMHVLIFVGSSRSIFVMT